MAGEPLLCDCNGVELLEPTLFLWAPVWQRNMCIASEDNCQSGQLESWESYLRSPAALLREPRWVGRGQTGGEGKVEGGEWHWVELPHLEGGSSPHLEQVWLAQGIVDFHRLLVSRTGAARPPDGWEPLNGKLRGLLKPCEVSGQVHLMSFGYLMSSC